MLLTVEAEAGRAEFLRAQVADCRMKLTQGRSAVVAESTSGATAGRAQRVLQMPVRDDPAIVVIHSGKELYQTPGWLR
jgi:hypothetical protein